MPRSFLLIGIRLLAFLHAVALAAEPAKPPPPPALQPASVATTPGMPRAEPGAFSIVVLPDTQLYSQLHPEIFHQQTQWIADSIKR